MSKLDLTLKRALHTYADAEVRWQKRRETGLTDQQLKEAVGFELGISGGASRDGIADCYSYRGGEQPAVWIGSMVARGRPTLSGVALIKEARRVLGIPQVVSRGQLSLFLEAFPA